MVAQEAPIKINCLTIPTYENVVSLYRNKESTQYFVQYEAPDGTPIDAAYWLSSPTFFKSEDFYVYAEKLQEHEKQLKQLNRHNENSSVTTLWGTSYEKCEYAVGVIFYRTPDHGGFYLSEQMNERVHYLYRNTSCWYEEDVEAFKIINSFPELFTDLEKANADIVLRNFFPFPYEKINNVSLSEGESFVKDREAFYYQHRNDWIGTFTSPIYGRSNVIRVEA